MMNRLRLRTRLTICLISISCLAWTCTALGYDGSWPKFFDYTVGPAHYGTTAHDCSIGIDPNGFYPPTDPLRRLITPVPRPGAYLPWDHEQITTCYDRVLQAGRPLTINLNAYTFPLGDNPNAENRDPQALSKTMDYLSSLPAQGNIPNSEGRLDYVLMDLETSWASITNANVAEAVNQVRAHSNPRINQAKVGNYNYFPCSELPWLPYPSQNSSSRQQMVNGAYDSTDVNVAMPSLYPYEYYEVHTRSSTWGTQVAPNKRSALFWAPLAKLSETKKCLPAGHELIPYMNNMVQYTNDSYHADPPTKEDCAALLQHTRLRGADGYYIWRTYAFEMEDGTPYSYDNDEYRGDMLEAWTSLDWLYAGTSQPQILNLETDKLSGLQWSATTTDQGAAVLVSNLGNSPVWFDMPDVGQYNDHLIDGFEIAPGTHRLETYQLPLPPTGPSIISHSGQINPVTEGWTESIDYMPDDPPGTGTVSGVGVNDNGKDSWNITTDRAWLRYVHDLSESELAVMSDGWQASIEMRIDTPSYAPGFDANFEIATGSWVTSLLFGTDDNGAPLLSYLSDWSLTMTPIDLSALNLDSGYHTYTLRANGDVEKVSLYVDDNFVTNLFVLPTGAYSGWEKRILWGDTERGSIALDAFYANVTLNTIHSEEPIPGDANGDGKVDGSDVTILAGNWQHGVGMENPDATWAMGDFNDDGKVDGSDVTILAGNWQAGVTAGAASVPEPSTLMMLLGLSSTALFTWCRRR